ncbi:hypothetical protein [Romboutsia sp.]|nr:hypothetical protein [Romboutsia sp.]HSQ90172.1 hypothetical protein [Romboutsia sp.]
MNTEGKRKTNCRWCGKNFYTKDKRKKTCCYKCTLNYNKKQKEKYKL